MLRNHHRIHLRPARSVLLVSVAAFDPPKRWLAAALGALAQRLRRSAAPRLDQRRRRQHVPAVVFHVCAGLQRSSAGRRLPGGYTLLTPFSRRLMLITNIPFVVHNNIS